MKKTSSFRSLIFSVLIVSAADLSAQDIHFSQFTQSPLSVNPAQAGTSAWIRGVMQYRDQWRAVTTPSAYKTIAASFDIKTQKRWTKQSNMLSRFIPGKEKGLGWGVNLYSDKAGDGNMGVMQGNLTVAYQVKTGQRSMIALGLQGGFLQRSVDFSNLHWGSEYDWNTGKVTVPPGYVDPSIATADQNFIVPDVSSGISYSYKKSERYMRGNDQTDFVFGLAAFHLNQPKYSYLTYSSPNKPDKLYRRYVAHGQGTFGISNTSIAIVPGVLIEQQGPNNEVVVGSLFRYMLREDSRYTGFVKGAAISAGGYYRNKDAAILAMLFEFSSFGIGVSYDINLSGLKPATVGRGAFEITLRFLNPSPFVFSKASFN